MLSIRKTVSKFHVTLNIPDFKCSGNGERLSEAVSDLSKNIVDTMGEWICSYALMRKYGNRRNEMTAEEYAMLAGKVMFATGLKLSVEIESFNTSPEFFYSNALDKLYTCISKNSDIKSIQLSKSVNIPNSIVSLTTLFGKEPKSTKFRIEICDGMGMKITATAKTPNELKRKLSSSIKNLLIDSKIDEDDDYY